MPEEIKTFVGKKDGFLQLWPLQRATFPLDVSFRLVWSSSSCFLFAPSQPGATTHPLPARHNAQLLKNYRNISTSLPDGLIYSRQDAAVRSCVNVGLRQLSNVLIFISIMYYSGREQSVCPPSRGRLCEMNSLCRLIRPRPPSSLCRSLHPSSVSPRVRKRHQMFKVFFSWSVSLLYAETVMIEHVIIRRPLTHR